MRDRKKKLNPAYVLSANDNPGTLITHVQLNDTNFDEWARAIQMALRAKKKLGFIDGTLTKPEEATSDGGELEEWDAVNAMLGSWILNTIEPTLRSSITPNENVKKLWDDICERFAENNGVRIQQIKAGLLDLRQRGTTVVVYYGRLKKLWDELADYDQNPTCKCGGCKCDISAKLDRKREEERLHQFLAGLDEAVFGTVRSNILSMDPLPSVGKAYSKVCQEERVRNNSRNREGGGDIMGMAVQFSGGNRKGSGESKDQNLFCTYCSKTGHDVGSCFQVIGYPDWWGDRSKTTAGGRGRGASRGRGGVAGGRGRSGGAAPRANTVRFAGSVSDSNGGVTVDADRLAQIGLTQGQLDSFLGILKSIKEGGEEKLNGKRFLDWIVDSGASRHVTGVAKSLQNLNRIPDDFVGLPDGGRAKVTHEGQVEFSPHLRSNRVLFVPNLKCNLLSVSQMVDELDCDVLFTKKFLSYAGPEYEDGDWTTGEEA